jgi:hypothetical protein
MNQEIYRYTFDSSVAANDIESTLLLSIMATESLHGASQVRLDTAHVFDADRRICVIDATTPVGRDINRLFTGFVTQEFGEDAFEVHRVDAVATSTAIGRRNMEKPEGEDSRHASTY